MNIISASRRTDIPAFYSEWFINRIRAGFALWQNPFSRAIYKVSIQPEDVSAIVFWSKDYHPLFLHLDEIDTLGYNTLFHYTINGAPREFEPNLPNLADSLKCADLLAARYGSDRVLWRYDPIILSTVTDAKYHIARFKEIAQGLEGRTSRCYFSFVSLYGKTTRNIEKMRLKTGIECRTPDIDEQLEICSALSKTASEHGIGMYSCCGDHLVINGVMKAHCIDAELLIRLFPDRIQRALKGSTRKQCGCCESKDIGAYDTCPHGCVYCYANTGKDRAKRSADCHNPESEILI
ncbi:MAG: DUF1848 domain-containing protein [Armatimonadota bacterium]